MGLLLFALPSVLALALARGRALELGLQSVSQVFPSLTFLVDELFTTGLVCHDELAVLDAGFEYLFVSNLQGLKIYVHPNAFFAIAPLIEETLPPEQYRVGNTPW